MQEPLSRSLLESRIDAIEARNAKVAADKAWESSLTRRGAIALMTYLVAGFSLHLLGSTAPWFYAIIPVIGYVLSTLALPHLRHLWHNHVYDKNR